MSSSSKNLAINAKWTAVAPEKGWQHFWIARRCYRDENLFVELMAACDRAVLLEISAQELTQGGRFVPGWKTLATKENSRT